MSFFLIVTITLSAKNKQVASVTRQTTFWVHLPLLMHSIEP
jgi:hypothetical protein